MSYIKILWLDDDFQSAILAKGDSDKENNRRRLEKAKEDANLFGFEVDGVPFYDEFLAKLKQWQQYQVVILDLHGLDRKDSQNNRIFKEANDRLQGLPLKKYIYSGTINDDPGLKYIIEDFEKEGGVKVSKNVKIPDFFQLIKHDLESAPYIRYYNGHEYCLQLMKDGFIDASERTWIAMNDIMKHYHEKDYLYNPYNNMRIILENMLDQLVRIGEIRLTKESADEITKFNKRLNYISRDCYPKKDSEGFDYNNPVYPFEKCPREIRIVLQFMGDLTNNWSHFLHSHPDYLREGETSAVYNAHIQDAAYESFFVIMRWYLSRRIINKESKPGLKILGKIELL